MLNNKELKKAAREQLYINRFFLLIMFLALSLETGGAGLFPSISILALSAATASQLVVKLVFRIIITFVISFSVSNIVYLIRDSVYLEMAKSKLALKVDVVPEKIESLWLLGFFGGWILFAKIILYILFFPAAIIKWLEYSQTYFILADNPKIGIKKAMLMSQKITEGHKKDLALLFLSFIGWFILTLSSFGIVLIYLIPYIRLTFANAYLLLKEEAIKNGKIDGGVLALPAKKTLGE